LKSSQWRPRSPKNSSLPAVDKRSSGVSPLVASHPDAGPPSLPPRGLQGSDCGAAWAVSVANVRGGVNLSRLGRRRSRRAAGDGEKSGSGRALCFCFYFSGRWSRKRSFRTNDHIFCRWSIAKTLDAASARWGPESKDDGRGRMRGLRIGVRLDDVDTCALGDASPTARLVLPWANNDQSETKIPRDSQAGACRSFRMFINRCFWGPPPRRVCGTRASEGAPRGLVESTLAVRRLRVTALIATDKICYERGSPGGGQLSWAVESGK